MRKTQVHVTIPAPSYTITLKFIFPILIFYCVYSVADSGEAVVSPIVMFKFLAHFCMLLFINIIRNLTKCLSLFSKFTRSLT